jgi:hypothetical protein
MAQPESRSAAALAGTGMAAVLLVLQGVTAILLGVAEISRDQVYGAVGKYVYKFDIVAWGWIHLVLGSLVLLVGLALFTGSVVARGIAVALSMLAVVANFMYLPYQPFWSAIAIGLGLFVIWSLFHTAGEGAV